MTDVEAEEQLVALRKHFGWPVLPLNRFCAAFTEWLNLTGELSEESSGWRDTGDHNRLILQIEKSCLLDRMIHCGEKASQTKCPVHEGRWSGIQMGWPGSKWANGEPGTVSPDLQAKFDKGCRCFLHRCGCTTGWQPDEHCGCGVKP